MLRNVIILKSKNKTPNCSQFFFHITFSKNKLKINFYILYFETNFRNMKKKNVKNSLLIEFSRNNGSAYCHEKQLDLDCLWQLRKKSKL